MWTDRYYLGKNIKSFENRLPIVSGFRVLYQQGIWWFAKYSCLKHAFQASTFFICSVL